MEDEVFEIDPRLDITKALDLIRREIWGDFGLLKEEDPIVELIKIQIKEAILKNEETDECTE